ncbi:MULTISPECIES: DUF6517 family protein [Halomicrobium]|uniref:Lipoprotein n=2 Tax=Halomicrobium mukohataei TaxID=57705 RepID=C7NWK6_HALMD|nr:MULTISPECIES: DUF6517 family protein [Halomicrobium]ACV48216.1 conserved hypothetical protein [Halomicrobium mukohataei DSM 12286]QCD66638.1 hypothetical protein E5139_13660 [Halomicrobium mukohataei]QFR21444.1 hypothetical protein GBQ70_13675 [Halomicrobium sp. ZPS1]
MRTLAILLSVALVATTAGCGFLIGDEALAFESAPASVGDETLSETGYEQTLNESQTVSREFTVAGQSRQVNVTNHLAQYERSIDLGPLGEQRAAVFATFSSPEVSVASQTFNPLSDMSNRELLSQFSSSYDGLSVGQRVENRTHTVLGTETGVQKYGGTAELGGQSIDVYIHVTTVKHDGDYVVALGLYPQQLSGEETHVFAMLDGLQHGE